MGEACINLPFVPYPGLYLTMEKSRKRGQPWTLYLRVRAVEWEPHRKAFRCMVDEMLGSNLISETFEVRGSPRSEQHFLELERTLRIFGVEVTAGVTPQRATDKCLDGGGIVLPRHIVRRVVGSPPRRGGVGG